MFDQFRLKDVLAHYKQNFVSTQWGNEKYKWEAVKWFQDNWDVNAQNFPEMLTSGAGIICHDDEGNTNLHVHMSLSDRYGNAHGGHLVEGTKVLLTVDVMLAEVDGLVMGRKFDNELEVPLFAPRQN